MNRGKIKVMHKGEAKQAFEHGNPNGDTSPVYGTVLGWLDKGIEDYNDKSALYFQGKELDYKDLGKLSNRVANYLINQGIKKGDRVGMSLDRSIEMVLSMIGILKSGAVFVPLDPNYPANRIQMMQEDVKLNLIIAHQNIANRLELDTRHIAIWKELEGELSTFSAKDPQISIKQDDVAYIVFTSGSTGRPKAIEMPHRSLSNVIEAQLEQNYFDREAKLLQYSSISVDVSFQGMFSTFASGGTVYLLKDSEHRDSRIILKKIREYDIQRIFVPYVAFRSLVEAAIATNSIPSTLTEVITAGEQLRVDAAVREFFSKIPGAILDNQYGASETHVVSSNILTGNPERWPDLPSVGKPMKNSSIYILNENMQPAGEGEAGELYLAGRNLANGYIGRDDLTEESFIKNPFNIDNRPVLYKSGDLGSYNKDGSIELLGRADHQIKIRGFRVEPGEINNIGAEFTGVSQCITHSIENQIGEVQLVLYYVCKKGAEVTKKEFKKYFERSLPDYMVPFFLVEIDEIPYTPSGKVDFKSLPDPQSQIISNKKDVEIKYQSETEAILAKIWQELLNLPSIPRTESFFDLGGDSLMAVKLFLQIEKQFGKTLPLSLLIQAQTIKALAKRLEGPNKKVDFENFRSLKLLQKGEDHRIPLFLVHGGAGNILIFKELAEALDDDIPIMAFQWPGWDGSQGISDIVEIAKFYIKELREAYPSGPYRLAGHCVGGIIALEIAELLRADGADVIGPILITDTPNLHSKYYRKNQPSISDEEFWAYQKTKSKLLSTIPRECQKKSNSRIKSTKSEQYTKQEKLSLLSRLNKAAKKLPFYKSFKTPLKTFYFKLKFFISRMAFARHRFKYWSIVKLSKRVPLEDRKTYSAISLIHALGKHKQKIFDENILYLRSSLMDGRTLGFRGWWDDLFMGASELCSGRFDGHVVGGPHNDILNNSYAHKIIKERMFADN
ncbi:MAG TPA: amino acid adenylation domain-containing protein, partial [Balneolaceae bacterium]|nr:amino acid adenylation domain-containing protein [Balneolaceae bacterium]